MTPMDELAAALRELNRIVREGGTEAERVAARARIVALLGSSKGRASRVVFETERVDA